MQPVSTGARRYDAVTMIFHWSTAILVLTQWFGAQTIDLFPRGALQVGARSMHIVGGLLLSALLVARIIWRMTRGRRLPPADKGGLDVLAKVVQWGLYGLLVAMVLVGMLLAWTRGDSFFGLFRIPAYEPGNNALADQVQGIHAAIGWLILALAGLHASAALVHRYLWHDDVLGRMLPLG
jgi:cytochrome b561